jgi:hypothetical protein
VEQLLQIQFEFILLELIYQNKTNKYEFYRILDVYAGNHTILWRCELQRPLRWVRRVSCAGGWYVAQPRD